MKVLKATEVVLMTNLSRVTIWRLKTKVNFRNELKFQLNALAG